MPTRGHPQLRRLPINTWTRWPILNMPIGLNPYPLQRFLDEPSYKVAAEAWRKTLRGFKTMVFLHKSKSDCHHGWVTNLLTAEAHGEPSMRHYSPERPVSLQVGYIGSIWAPVQVQHLLAVGPLASQFAFLSLSFHISKMALPASTYFTCLLRD